MTLTGSGRQQGLGVCYGGHASDAMYGAMQIALQLSQEFLFLPQKEHWKHPSADSRLTLQWQGVLPSGPAAPV